MASSGVRLASSLGSSPLSTTNLVAARAQLRAPWGRATPCRMQAGSVSSSSIAGSSAGAGSSTALVGDRATLQELIESVKDSLAVAPAGGRNAARISGSWVDAIRPDTARSGLEAAMVQLDGAVTDLSTTLFDGLTLVDNLERLALSAHFKNEINHFLELLYRHCWSKNAGLANLRDTSLAFLLLRQHGFQVSQAVFEKFKKLSGELMTHEDSLGTVLNFYRASQRAYLGETLLEDGKGQAFRVLKEKQTKNSCLDEVLNTDLSHEVNVELNRPWKATIWRSTQRRFIEDFTPRPATAIGDVWVRNNPYLAPTTVDQQGLLELAKANFNLEQSKHRQEIEKLERWYLECNLDKINMGKRGMVTESYFGALGAGAQADLWEALAACTQNSVLLTVADDYFDLKLEPFSEMQTFVEAIRRWDPLLVQNGSELQRILFFAIYDTVNSMSEAASSTRFQGRDIGRHLRGSYVRVLEAMLTEAEWNEKAYLPSLEEYLKVAEPSFALEPILLSTLLFMPNKLSDDILEGPDYLLHMHLVSHLGRLLNDVRSTRREREMGKFNSVTIWMDQNPSLSVEEAEQQLLQKAEEATKQLMRLAFTHKQGDAAMLHPEGRLLFLGMSSEINFLYYSTDEWSKPESEMKGMVKDMLFCPIL